MKLSSTRSKEYEIIQKVLEKEIQDGQNIIEVGCGNALMSYELKLKKHHVKVSLLDINKKTILGLKKNFKKTPLIVGDILNLPFKSNAFDVAYNEGVIEHTDTEKAIKEMCRISKKIIIFVPNGGHPVYLGKKYFRKLIGKWPWDELYGKERNITLRMLEKWIEKSNFKIKKIFTFSFRFPQIGVIAERS